MSENLPEESRETVGPTVSDDYVAVEQVPPDSPDDPLLAKASGGWKRSVAVGAIVLVAAAGAFGIGKATNGNDTNTEPRLEPSVSAPANPGETGSVGQTSEFGINTKEFAKTPEALATDYYSQLNRFLIAGADEEAAKADKRFEIMKDSEYVAVISQEVDQKFINELFVPDWQSSPQLASYVNSLLEVAHSTRWDRLESYAGGTANQEPYVREFLIDGVASTTDPLVTNVRWRGYDNGDMTTADDNNAPGSIDPNTDIGGDTLTWINVDGQLKISDFAHFAD